MAAWVTVDQPQEWGGIFSAIEDNGEAEKGLVLGYDQERFYVGLATEGGSDEDGTIEYLRADRPFVPGRWHHVAATYDGHSLTLFVDGEPTASSTRQSGDVLWPEEFGVWLGGYHDIDESNPHHGRIGDVKLFAVCAKPSWVAHEFEHGADLVALPADAAPERVLPRGVTPRIVVKPYLQWGTTDSMTIMWETAHACRGVVEFGEDHHCRQSQAEAEQKTLHEITLEGLEPDMLYFYRTLSPPEAEATAAATASLSTDVRTFQTAGDPDDPIGFAVICDSQAQTGSATLGDTRAKQLVTLYDKHSVDVVWNGHIHSYERTWMIRGGKPVEKGGTVYMITGGAGGHLETFGPYRPAFQNRVRRGHHFCYVTCFGNEFDIKAFDDRGQLFDHAVLRKSTAGANR